MTAYHAWQPFFFHLSGAGYSLYAYEVDTVIPITTYADKDKVASNTWPVILDDDGSGNGVATVYIDETYATLDLRDLDDVSVDGYPANWVKPAQQSEVDSIDARLVLNEATDVAQTLAIGTAQADIIALDGRMDTAEGNITSLDGRLDIAEGSITSLDGRLDTAENNITSLDGRLDTAEGNITALDGRLDTAEGNITSLDGRLDTAESDITSLDGRLDVLETIDHNPPTGSSGSFYDPTADILMQWGTATTSAGGTASVTFGTAYTANPNVQLTSYWSGSYQNATGIDLESKSTTGFSCRAGYVTNGSTVWEPSSISFEWFAIGQKT